MKKLQNFYTSPTPILWKRVGDGILGLQVFLIGAIPGLPLTDKGKIWCMFFVGIFGVIGKFATNFAVMTDPPATEDVQASEKVLNQTPKQP